LKAYEQKEEGNSKNLYEKLEPKLLIKRQEKKCRIKGKPLLKTVEKKFGGYCKVCRTSSFHPLFLLIFEIKIDA